MVSQHMYTIIIIVDDTHTFATVQNYEFKYMQIYFVASLIIIGQCL